MKHCNVTFYKDGIAWSITAIDKNKVHSGMSFEDHVFYALQRMLNGANPAEYGIEIKINEV